MNNPMTNEKSELQQAYEEQISMTVRLGQGVGVSGYELEALRMGSILHDVGKIAVPREILNKPGKLDQDEWKIITNHPDAGYKICLPLQKTLGPALDVIRHHHEKLDGTGYPDGIRGGDISLSTSVTAIADIYDALITDRPYRKAMPREKALDILREEGMEGKLDKELLKEFIARMRK